MKKLSIFIYIILTAQSFGESYKEKIIPSDASINEWISKIKDSRLIYLGEQHTAYAHHLMQASIAAELLKSKKNIAIGMEMFEEQFQQTIDLFIQEKITEKEFLAQTLYFSKWGFDYNLYKPVLDFAQKNKVQVIALNVDNKLVRASSKDAFRQISSEDLNKLPDDMNFSSDEYFQRLSGAFNMHTNMGSIMGGRDMRNFVLAQTIRDEAMAEKASIFLKEHKNTTLIILAGNGHIEYKNGIPDRLFRRSKLNYKTILMDYPFDPSAGDYFLYTKEASFQESPKLNIMIKNPENGTEIIGFTSEEIEKSHALKKGDIIQSIDGEQILDIADLRLFLYGKKYGDSISIKVLREAVSTDVTCILQETLEDIISGHGSER